MKKFFGLIMILLLLGCSDKKDCDCTAYGLDFSPTTVAAKSITFCHGGKTIEVSDNVVGHGQTHTDGTECFLGSCNTAGLDDFEGVPYSSDCKDDGKSVTIDNVQAVVICTDKE